MVLHLKVFKHNKKKGFLVSTEVKDPWLRRSNAFAATVRKLNRPEMNYLLDMRRAVRSVWLCLTSNKNHPTMDPFEKAKISRFANMEHPVMLAGASGTTSTGLSGHRTTNRGSLSWSALRPFEEGVNHKVSFRNLTHKKRAGITINVSYIFHHFPA